MRHQRSPDRHLKFVASLRILSQFEQVAQQKLPQRPVQNSLDDIVVMVCNESQSR